MAQPESCKDINYKKQRAYRTMARVAIRLAKKEQEREKEQKSAS